MRLALARGDVVGPDGASYSGVVTTTGGRLRVQSRSASHVFLDVGATAVVPTGRRTWTVSTEVGEFTVTRPRGCGCGG